MAKIKNEKARKTYQSKLQTAQTQYLGNLYQQLVISTVPLDKKPIQRPPNGKSFTEHMKIKSDEAWSPQITVLGPGSQFKGAVEGAIN